MCDDGIYNPLLENEEDLSDASKAALYYLIGAILSKTKKIGHIAIIVSIVL